MIINGVVSGFSYVVKRFPQFSHCLRRRIEELSSVGLESMTRVSAALQNGHFIPFSFSFGQSPDFFRTANLAAQRLTLYHSFTGFVIPIFPSYGCPSTFPTGI